MLKDFLRALSLANLCFIVVWAQLIVASLNPQAQWQRYDLNNYAAVFLTLPALALVFWLALTFARRSRYSWAMPLARGVFLFVLVAVINGILITEYPRLALNDWALILSWNWLALLRVLILLALLVALIQFHRPIAKAGAVIVTVMFPFLFITFGQTIWVMTKSQEQSPAPVLPAKPQSPRIVWMIFDELDQRLAFAQRPQSLQMPEMDRFRAEALSATNAYPPAYQTLLSMPALITGKLVSRARPVSPDELLLFFGEEPEPVGWSKAPTLFSQARELGYNTALTGYYHPYGRVIGNSLTVCRTGASNTRSLGERAKNQLQMVAATIPFLANLRILNTKAATSNLRRRLNLYFNSLADAKQMVTDPNLGITLLHLPIPHLPVIYNRRTDEFKRNRSSNYLDNLALADLTLGELRRAMEEAGVWDSTTVLISADHPLRSKNWKDAANFWPPEDAPSLTAPLDLRIPFILKLSGQQKAIVYESPFNTVLTHDLFLAVLQGEVKTADEAAKWLEAHRTIGESPYKRRPRN